MSYDAWKTTTPEDRVPITRRPEERPTPAVSRYVSSPACADCGRVGPIAVQTADKQDRQYCDPCFTWRQENGCLFDSRTRKELEASAA